MRHALSIGIARFGDQGTDEVNVPAAWKALDFARDRSLAIVEILTRFGYTCAPHPPRETLTSASLADSIWQAARQVGPDGVLVVHLLTHGYVSETGALYAVGTDGSHHASSDVGQWLRRMVDIPGAPLTLFLLDLCNAGVATRLSWQMSLTDGDNRAWVIAACGPNRSAFNGRFSEAVVNVLRDFADSRVDIDPALPYIPLTTVAREIRREVRRLADDQNALPQEVTGSIVDISADPAELPFFPNPLYVGDSGFRARPSVDVALAPFLNDVDDTLDPRHFVERAAGQGPFGRTQFALGCFRGRRRELRILAAWFDGRDDVRTRVVTGSPGVGKSALLGVLVCAAHPVLREPTQAIWEHVDKYPEANERLVAVHARQRSLTDLIRSLARQLCLTVIEDGVSTARQLIAQIVAHPVPPVIVVDALDEAVNPVLVMSHLLLPLARADREDGRPACRLLVATRPWDEFSPLRSLANAAGGLVDLDAVPATLLRYDLEDYVSDLLRRHKPYDTVAYAGARQTFATAVATALTEVEETGAAGETPAAAAPIRRRAWGEFLVAGLYAHHFVVGYPPSRDVEGALRLGGRVPMTLPELLELDLTVQAGARWLRPVLAAVAHARGDGMPARIIGQAARTFLGVQSPQVASDDEIAEALTAARFYLHRSSDVDGTTLYRLFHQGLADHLRAHPVQRSVAGAADPRLLLAAILAPLAGSPGLGRRWDIAEPYLLRHAGQHAVDAGQAAVLVDDVEYLVYADPAAVVPLLGGHPWLTADDLLAVAAASGPSVHRRRHFLALCAIRRGAHDAAWRLANPPGRTPVPWQPVWSADATTGAPASVTAVACAPGADVVAVADSAGGLRLYDRYRGDPLTEPLTGDGSAVAALAYGHHAGRLVLLSLDEGGRLQLRDGLDGRALCSVAAAAGATADGLSLLSYRGRLAAAYADEHGQGWLTDVMTGRHTTWSGLTGQATGLLGDRAVRLSIAADRDFVVADAGGGPDDAGEVAQGDGYLLCFAARGRLMVAVGRGPEVVIWDVDEHRKVGLVPLTAPVEALAATENGDVAVVTGGQVVFLSHGGEDRGEAGEDRSQGSEDRDVRVATGDREPMGDTDGEAQPAPASDNPFSNFQEIMDAYFGADAPDAQRPRPRTRPGADAILRLELDLVETAFGVEAPITVDTAVLCEPCAGAGTAPGTHLATCETCGGRGEVRSVQRTFLGEVVTAPPCQVCQGYGSVILQPCPTCAGDGRIRTRRALTVKIPAGVEDGMRIRLARQGEVGPCGGTAGDLYVEIHERPHDVYSRKGDDLHCRVTLPMTAAALGARLTIKTLDGEEDVEVKPGTQPGATLRIRGKGVPHLRGQGRGELFVHHDVRTPTDLTAREQDVLRQLVDHQYEPAKVVTSSYAEHGPDVHLDVTVPMAQAALGTSVEVRTPKGDVVVPIKIGTQPGSGVRLSGSGRRNNDDGSWGDLLVNVIVTVPTAPDATVIDLMGRLAELRGEASYLQDGSTRQGFLSRMRTAFTDR